MSDVRVTTYEDSDGTTASAVGVRVSVLAGSTGPQGKPGDPGTPGASAYEVAVSQGFAGTEAEWLTSLHGPEGAPGRDGLDGAPGAPGDNGAPGPANTLTVGTVTTEAAGSTASATITGASPNQTLNLAIPQGQKGADGSDGAPGQPGPANTLSIGTVTTGAAGSFAAATITGTSPNQTLSLTIPQGLAGSNGTNGVNGADGSKWYHGAGAPAGATGVVGDYYLNDSTGDVYNKTGASAWTLTANIKGPAGTNGTNGSAGPAGAGVPAGGTAGYNLRKKTAADYDTEWVPPSTKALNAQTGTAYTLTLADAGAFVTLTNAGAITLTVPSNSTANFSYGTIIEGAQLGAGQVTITPAAGVTINATPGLKVAAQYGTFGLIKTNTDTWLAYGRLSA